MNIKFYIKADETADGRILIREYYDIKGGALTARGVPELHLEDIVDEEIKKTHAKEYAAFKEALKASKEDALELAKAKVGEKIYIAPVAVEVPVVEEESAPIGKKESESIGDEPV